MVKLRRWKEEQMAKKKNKPTYECIVFIVEGDADELIIQKLIAYYKQQGWQPTQSIDIKNVHGFPTEKKIKQKLTEISQVHSNKDVKFTTVCCEFDTDVLTINRQFDEPDWNVIEKSIKVQYSLDNFCLVRASTSIEDWMLDDQAGLLKALQLPAKTKPIGFTGQERVSSLFKKKNIKYDCAKGKDNIRKYIEALDIEKIRNSRKEELASLEKALGISALFKNTDNGIHPVAVTAATGK